MINLIVKYPDFDIEYGDKEMSTLLLFDIMQEFANHSIQSNATRLYLNGREINSTNKKIPYEAANFTIVSFLHNKPCTIESINDNGYQVVVNAR